MPDRQFYLPQAVGQWDMSSSECINTNMKWKKDSCKIKFLEIFMHLPGDSELRTMKSSSVGKWETNELIGQQCTSCLVNPVTSAVLDGFLPYLAQMIPSMKWCVVLGDLWPWPIFKGIFAIKTAKMLHILCPFRNICSYEYSFIYVYIGHKWPLAWECVVHNVSWLLTLLGYI